MQFAAKTTGKSQELPRNAETAPAISPRQRNRHPRFGAVAFACSSSSQKQDCPRTVHASINSISEAPAPSQRTGVETASNVLFECPGLTESRPHHHIGRTARTWATGSLATEAELRVDGCGCHARYGGLRGVYENLGKRFGNRVDGCGGLCEDGLSGAGPTAPGRGDGASASKPPREVCAAAAPEGADA